MNEHKDEEHSSFLAKIFNKKNEPTSKEELEEVIVEATENEVIDEETGEMLQGIFDITRLRVSDVMIPVNEIVTININSTVLEAAKVVQTTAHSRYPVIGEDKDHIVGILLAKDLIPYLSDPKEMSDVSISNLLRTAIIVPESKRINSMLKEFQQNRFHVAIVVDEFGGVSGLVTIEDILEVIVGDIDDEYDTEINDDNIVKSKEGKSFIVKGVTTLEEFDEFFSCSLEDLAEVDTIAGLTTHVLGRFPKIGETISIENFTFKVLDANDRRVHLLEVSINENTEEQKE